MQQATKMDNVTRRRVTAEHSFFSCDPSGTALFTVRADVSIDSALNSAAALLDTAFALMTEAATDMEGGKLPDSRRAWAAAYLAEMSKALVDAAINGQPKGAE